MGNTKCPVCETSMELQTDYCPTCGFQRHIFPNGVSEKVQADENERIAKAKEFYDAYEAAKSAADNAKAAHKETKDALKKEKTDHEETKSNLAKEQTAHNRTLDALKKEQTALKDEEAAHEETKSNLDKEQTAHNKTKAALKKEQAALKDEEAAHEETKKKLDDAIKNPPTPPRPVSTPPPGPNKKVIGKALFTQGGRSEAVDLYEGGCRVTAPAWTNVKGELFEIICDNGMYFLRDLSGRMYNRHERKISPLVTVSNRDAFRIGELIIKLSFPRQ